VARVNATYLRLSSFFFSCHECPPLSIEEGSGSMPGLSRYTISYSCPLDPPSPLLVLQLVAEARAQKSPQVLLRAGRVPVDQRLAFSPTAQQILPHTNDAFRHVVALILGGLRLGLPILCFLLLLLLLLSPRSAPARHRTRES